MKNKGRGLWKILLPSIVVVALQYFVAMLGSYGTMSVMAFQYKSGGLKDFIAQYEAIVTSADFNMWVMFAYSIMVVCVFLPWYYKRFAKGTKLKDSAKRMTKNPGMFGIGIICFGVGLQYLAMYIMNVLSVFFPQWLSVYEELMESTGVDDGVTVAIVLYMVIFGPVCEELAFRGLTMKYAEATTSFVTANILQALLFAAMHMNPLQSVYTFFMGLFLGYFVHKSGSILLGIILHIFFNGIGVLGNSLIVGGSNPLTFGVILFLAMAVTYIGYLLIDRNIPEKREENVSKFDATV